MLDPSTVNRWWLRYKREGNFLPRKRHGREARVSLSYLKTYKHILTLQVMIWESILV